jgi:two-component system, NarL family, response regulator NreC
MIGVFIADDHAVMRVGLRMLIDGQSDMQVVGEAPDGPSAESGVLATNPDVALMDISMPGRDGIETIARILKQRPRIRVLVFTVHDEPGFVRAALSAGAAGYVEKRAIDTELLAAIRAVANGRAFVNVTHADLVRGTSDPSELRRPPSLAADVALLSARERQVLQRVAEGHTNREVAQELHLSVKSVEAYRARLMTKLGLKTRAELVRYTLERGLLRVPPARK